MAFSPGSSWDLSKMNFNDKSSRHSLVLGVNIAAIVLISSFVSLRFYVRACITCRFFLDDAFAALASLFSLGLCTTILLAGRRGLGEHIWNLNTDTILTDLLHFVQLFFIGNIFGGVAISFTKLSIVASYMRIFPYRRVRIVMYITAALTVANLIVTVFATIFQCHPVRAAWDFTIADPHCYKAVYYLYTNSAVNVATDLMLCITPLPFIWKLQMPRSRKILVCGLFFIGGLACVATIFRLTILDQIANPTDWTWQLVSPVALTVAECTIGICCCSVPAIRPLQVRLSDAGKALGISWDSFRSITPLCKTSRQERSEATRRFDEEENRAMGYRPPWLTTDGGVVEAGLRSFSFIPHPTTTTATKPTTTTTRDVESDGGLG